MGEAEGAANRWELSKENIQPLKQGRKATVLSVALDESAARKLSAERQYVVAFFFLIFMVIVIFDPTPLYSWGVNDILARYDHGYLRN